MVKFIYIFKALPSACAKWRINGHHLWNWCIQKTKNLYLRNAYTTFMIITVLVLEISNLHFFFFKLKKLASVASIKRSARETKIMANNNQMMMDRDAGEAESQPQQAQGTSEANEIQQTVSTTRFNWIYYQYWNVASCSMFNESISCFRLP